jgi:hypothetical protein
MVMTFNGFGNSDMAKAKVNFSEENMAKQKKFETKFWKGDLIFGAFFLIFSIVHFEIDIPSFWDTWTRPILSFMDTYQKSTKSSGNSYEYCSDKCSPALMTCLGMRPESEWSICQKEYNQCTARCK